MWNPFQRVKLTAVIPKKDIKPAVGPETIDPVYRAEIEKAQSRSLLARSQIALIHETLAQKALDHMRGGKECPE